MTDGTGLEGRVGVDRKRVRRGNHRPHCGFGTYTRQCVLRRHSCVTVSKGPIRRSSPTKCVVGVRLDGTCHEGGHQPGKLRDPRPDGRWRDGGGLPRAGYTAGARYSGQGATGSVRAPSRAHAAELHGSESDGTAKPATTPPLSRRCSMRRRNGVAYMRSNVTLNFSVLATAPPVSTIDLPSAATV